MSAFLAQIQAKVDLVFTDALGYDATFRSDVSTWYDDFIVPLVNTVTPLQDYTIPIVESVKDNSTDNYWVAVDPSFKELFYSTANWVVNLVLQSTGLGGSKNFSMIATQTGADPPTFVVINNSLGVASPVAARTVAGEYTFTFAAGTFPAAFATKCMPMDVPIFSALGFLAIARCIVVSTTVLKVQTYQFSSDILTGVITGATADAMLNATPISIDVYP